MNLKSLSALGAGLLLAACSQAPRTDSLTQYVDMRIGTGGHGHVFMGANVPFGAVQLGPKAGRGPAGEPATQIGEGIPCC